MNVFPTSEVVHRVRTSAGEFESFFAGHFSNVRRSLALIVGDIDAAEEAAAEAFARAFVRWRRVRAMSRPVAWVMVVALNVVRTDRARENRAAAWHGSTRPATVDDLSSSVVRTVELNELLCQLPERQRLCVVLRYYGDLSVAEIATIMKCAEGTVKSTLYAALRNLRIDLSSEEEESDEYGRAARIACDDRGPLARRVQRHPRGNDSPS
jgi:RNA polymerase sigma-70 factor (ECF subfamily)